MRTRSVLLPGILAAVVVALPGCGGSPTRPSSSVTPSQTPQILEGPFTVSGVVSEMVNGAAVGLSGVQVDDSQRHEGVTTAADGSYTIRNVEPHQGELYLYFAKSGYQPILRTIKPTKLEERFDIQLSRQ